MRGRWRRETIGGTIVPSLRTGTFYVPALHGLCLVYTPKSVKKGGRRSKIPLSYSTKIASTFYS